MESDRTRSRSVLLASLAKYVDRAGARSGVVGLVTVDARGGAGLEVGAGCQGRSVGRERDTPAKEVARAGVGRLDIGLLAPCRTGAPEQVDGAGPRRRVVGLVAIDAARRA